MAKKPRPGAGPESLAIVLPTKPPQLKLLGGSDDDGFNNLLCNDVMRSIWIGSQWSEEDKKQHQTAALVGLMAFKPADEIEGMLAAQAMALHHSMMECSRKAMVPEQPHEIAQGLRKAAVTASRAFTELLGALDRKRGKSGQQKVTVEHVHVHAGGQAIVGTVATGGRGGDGTKAEGEPHTPPAALVHDATAGAVVLPVWGAHQEREPVPVACHAERAVPDARGRQHGAAHR